MFSAVSDYEEKSALVHLLKLDEAVVVRIDFSNDPFDSILFLASAM
jgi:hypothetical protein